VSVVPSGKTGQSPAGEQTSCPTQEPSPIVALRAGGAAQFHVSSWILSFVAHAFILSMCMWITWEIRVASQRKKTEVEIVTAAQPADLLPVAMPGGETDGHDAPHAELDGLVDTSTPEPLDFHDVEQPSLPAATATLTEPLIAESLLDRPADLKPLDWQQDSQSRGEGLRSFRLGGKWGLRTGQGRAAGRYFGSSKESDQSVANALQWLAKVQEKNGHWNSVRWGARMPCDTGSTGLAVLAFLGAGYHPGQQRYGTTVRGGLNWLIQQLGPDGHLKDDDHVYGQGIATMALCEAYGMSKDSRYREPAQRAVNYVMSQMTPYGGFGYDTERDDTSVTGWHIMAIKSARLAGLEVPSFAADRSKQFLGQVLTSRGESRYRISIASTSRALTAVGLLCRLFLEISRDDETVVKIADLIRKWGPGIDDEYYTYHATYGMFQMGGDYWDEWNAKFRDALTGRQVKQGEAAGSWQPEGTSWGPTAGRVYVTAMYTLSLEVYYRFLPVYH
jgi:hypothetical protein